MFQNDFYQLNQTNQIAENSLEFQIQLNPKHAVFGGHFPGNPVTPGVMQMEVLKELLVQHFACSIDFLEMSSCKFLKVLNPEETPRVMVKVQFEQIQEHNQLKVQATFQANEVIFTKIASLYLMH